MNCIPPNPFHPAALEHLKRVVDVVIFLITRLWNLKKAKVCETLEPFRKKQVLIYVSFVALGVSMPIPASTNRAVTAQYPRRAVCSEHHTHSEWI